MWELDRLFEYNQNKKIWQKYCGFFDLSLEEFMRCQDDMLMQQIDLVAASPLAERFMPERPSNVEEYRQKVKFTTYEDYSQYFDQQNAEILPVKPYCWARTSGRGGKPKWIPFTTEFVEITVIYSIASLLLACAEKRGDVRVGQGVRVLQNFPPEPYGAAYYARAAGSQMGAILLPDPDSDEYSDFAERIQAGFKIALRRGVDILTSLSSVLIKMGERFTDASQGMKFSFRMLHPQVLSSMIRALWRSKREKRTILPKDLWPLKGLIAYGMDTDIYKDDLEHFWGRTPLQIYVATETGLIGTQAWNKKYMSFAPASSFWEFVPEDEWSKSREDEGYQPKTVLISELQVGKIYELVLSSFHGMPFFRYRLGDLVKIVSLGDEEEGIKTPQFVFYSRMNDLIDLAGFVRLDEKSVWQILSNSGIKYEDWSIRKEVYENKPVLHLYIEPKGQQEYELIREKVEQELIKSNVDYKDMFDMLEMRPLRVTVLSQGTYQRYYEKKKDEGADLAHLKPSHMNPTDRVIADLLACNSY